MKRSLPAAMAALVLSVTIVAPAAAQDTTRRGVTVGITYDPSSKPGIVVLPAQGPMADSVRAIVQRDLDNSDRFTVVTLDAADPATFRVASGALNYPVFAQLGAVAIVQMTVTPRGLHVALHDVSKKGVAGVQDIVLPAAALGRDWRMTVHSASDRIEAWITGRAGIAATRIAYVRGNGLRVIDSDGWGDAALPASGQVLSPAWSPSGREITYATFGVESRIEVLELGSGRTRVLPATPTPAMSRQRSPIRTLCPTCTRLSILVPSPTTVRLNRARSKVLLAPISTSSPMMTVPTCGSFSQRPFVIS